MRTSSTASSSPTFVEQSERTPLLIVQPQHRQAGDEQPSKNTTAVTKGRFLEKANPHEEADGLGGQARLCQNISLEQHLLTNGVELPAHGSAVSGTCYERPDPTHSGSDSCRAHGIHSFMRRQS